MSKIQCTNCEDVIESKHRHDFVSCSCRKASSELTAAFSGVVEEYMQEGHKLTPHLAVCVFEEIVGHGISLDGGDDHLKISGKLNEYIIIEEKGNDRQN